MDEDIQLLDATSYSFEIAKYKTHQVLFVVRGPRDCASEDCFAFTTYNGHSTETTVFLCHVFRCKLKEATNKIMLSFWNIFNQEPRQQSSSNTEIQGYGNLPVFDQ
jgi:hypothetical protein